MPKKRSTVRSDAIKAGYRSGLEQQIAAQLEQAGSTAQYEPCRLMYSTPATPHTYTPDWILPNGIVLEGKGRFLTSDRRKHKFIKEQNPNLDLRFVFSNPRSKIGKGSKTSYADWCEQYGFQYAERLIPDEWLHEPTNRASLAAIQRITKRASNQSR